MRKMKEYFTFMFAASIPSLVLFLLSVVGYIFFEALFFFTRPSFISLTQPSTVLAAVLVSSFLLILCVFLLWLIFFAIEFISAHYFSREINVKQLPTAFVVALLCLLLVDNFTYTVFHFGIISTKFFGHLFYIALLAYMVSFFHRKLNFFVKTRKNVLLDKRVWGFLAIGLTFCFLIFVVKLFTPLQEKLSKNESAHKILRPNIVFFSSDGIDAHRLSLYGYARNTTPALNTFAKERKPLLCKNAFSNGARTTGSLTSMLTGRLPATNKVFFPPHILAASHAHQHLPGIFKQLGYANFQESIRYYADAGDLNLQDAFDIANNRSLRAQNFLGRRFVTESYFISALLERVSSRLLHITGFRSMENFVEQMEGIPKPDAVYGTSDETRIERFKEFIRGVSEPFFAHIHLLDSHCCTFKFRKAHFSRVAKDSEEKPKETDLIDDGILASDTYFEEMIKILENHKMLERTLIVYSSDHNRGWSIKKKIPLMFFFPQGAHAYNEEKNCQLLDVAPTVLEYLGVAKPKWMEGRSLLDKDEYKSSDRIFAFLNIRRKRVRIGKSEVSELSDAGAPHYGLSSYAMVSCNTWYELDLLNEKIKSGKILGYKGKCDESLLPSKKAAKEEIIQHLRDKKLDIRFISKSAG